MSTTSRLVVSAALGGGLLLAAPAAAQEVACPYPSDCPIGGVGELPATGGDSGGSAVGTPSSTGNGSGSPTSLPFTGGEVTLWALTGVAALGGGALLVAAGRKRTSV